MNHQHIHDVLIRRAQERSPIEGVYYEKHHIIPKCEGGAEDGETVLLTFKEHKIIHLLRWKITGLYYHLYAFNLMKYGEKARRKHASYAARQVKNRGGIVSQKWRDENPEKTFQSTSNAGKKGGKVTGKKLWWNNGIENMRSLICPGDGWVRGMLMSDKKKNQVLSSFGSYNYSRITLFKTPDGIFNFKQAADFYSLSKRTIQNRVYSKDEKWKLWKIIPKENVNEE